MRRFALTILFLGFAVSHLWSTDIGDAIARFKAEWPTLVTVRIADRPNLALMIDPSLAASSKYKKDTLLTQKREEFGDEPIFRFQMENVVVSGSVGYDRSGRMLLAMDGLNYFIYGAVLCIPGNGFIYSTTFGKNSFNTQKYTFDSQKGIYMIAPRPFTLVNEESITRTAVELFQDQDCTVRIGTIAPDRPVSVLGYQDKNNTRIILLTSRIGQTGWAKDREISQQSLQSHHEIKYFDEFLGGSS